jgi:hypothetical protein
MNVDVLLHDMLKRGFHQAADTILRMLDGEKVDESAVEALREFATGLRSCAEAAHPAMAQRADPFAGMPLEDGPLPTLDDFVRQVGEANVATRVDSVEVGDGTNEGVDVTMTEDPSDGEDEGDQ